MQNLRSESRTFPNSRNARTIRVLRNVVTVVFAIAAAQAGAQSDAQSGGQSDADFVAAKAAFERGDWRRLDALAPALTGHPLERYVRYWQLKSRLDEAPADAVQSFIERYPDGPLADRLRVEWLKSLGKRDRKSVV